MALQVLRRNKRRGTIIIMATITLAILMAMVALAVDVGHLNLTRGQLQNTADSAALAGVSALHNGAGTLQLERVSISYADPSRAREEAQEFVQYHIGAGRQLDVDLNYANAPDGDIVIGRLYIPGDLTEPLDLNPTVPNAVRVLVRMDAAHLNGSVALFFGRVIGLNEVGLSASATAKAQYARVIPITTSEEKWQTLATGGDGDKFTYDYLHGAKDFGIKNGPDGIPEIQIQPGGWDGSGSLPPGNFGRIDIGPISSTMDVIRRQFDEGPMPLEFDFYGGSLYSGMVLSGETGFKSSAKHAIVGGTADARIYQGMLGEIAYLPIWSEVSGNGANAKFTISRFMAVRIMSITIDGRGRSQRFDNEGNDIQEIWIQPVVNPNDLNRPHLVR